MVRSAEKDLGIPKKVMDVVTMRATPNQWSDLLKKDLHIPKKVREQPMVKYDQKGH